jgi:cell division protein FtsB
LKAIHRFPLDRPRALWDSLGARGTVEGIRCRATRAGGLERVSDEWGTEDRGGVLAWFGRWLKAAMLPAFFLACCGYFLWHAVHGERGLIAREERVQRIAEAHAERDRVMGDLAAMERRVQGLRGDRLDRDQLDERARQLLNMVGKDEIVVPYPADRRLF